MNRLVLLLAIGFVHLELSQAKPSPFLGKMTNAVFGKWQENVKTGGEATKQVMDMVNDATKLGTSMTRDAVQVSTDMAKMGMKTGLNMGAKGMKKGLEITDNAMNLAGKIMSMFPGGETLFKPIHSLTQGTLAAVHNVGMMTLDGVDKIGTKTLNAVNKGTQIGTGMMENGSQAYNLMGKKVADATTNIMENNIKKVGGILGVKAETQ